MVYELTKEYLYQNFSGASDDTNFSEQHAASLARQILKSAGEGHSLSDYKDEIRQALKEFWGHAGNVSVFFKGRDKIAVKVLPAVNEVVSTTALRELVTENNEQKFVKEVIRELCDESLDFSTINNRTWESSYLASVKSGFFKAVYKKANRDREAATEVSLDIIRDNFAFLNDSLAEELLAKMITSKKAESFLEYYGKTVLGEGGIRFKTPDIIDRKKRQWHVSTLRPIVSKYLKEAGNLQKNIKSSEELREKILEMQEELLKIEESRDKIETHRVEAVIDYSESGERLNELRKYLSDLGRELNQIPHDKREEISKKIERQKEIIEEAKNRDIDARIRKGKYEKLSKERNEKEVKLKKKISGLQTKLMAEENIIIKQNKTMAGTKETYDFIVDAVANALMRKKIVVG